MKILQQKIVESFSENADSIAIFYRGESFTFEQLKALVAFRTKEIADHLGADDELVSIDSEDNLDHWITTLALILMGVSSTPALNNEGLPERLHNRKSIGTRSGMSVKVTGYREISQSFPAAPLKIVRSSQGASRVFYSSGTTGLKKAMAVDFDMMYSRIISSHDFFPHRNSCLSLMPPESVLGFHFQLGQWLKGGSVHLDRDFHYISKSISGKVLNYLVGSPHQIMSFMHDIEGLGRSFRGHFDEIIVSGAQLTEALQKKIQYVFNSSIVCLYGATETGHWSRKTISGKEDLRKLGRLDQGVSAELVYQIAAGHSELRIRSRHMVTEYMSGEPLSVWEDGWFYPGDIGIVTMDGDIELIGRTNEVMNLGGIKLSLGDLDDFVQGLAGVEDAACFGVKDALGYTELWMAIVLKDPKQLSMLFSVTLDQFGEHASPRRMVPVSMIPRTYSGKPQRNLMSEVVGKRINSIK